jgi:hypothetical protein
MICKINYLMLKLGFKKLLNSARLLARPLYLQELEKLEVVDRSQSLPSNLLPSLVKMVKVLVLLV